MSENNNKNNAVTPIPNSAGNGPSWVAVFVLSVLQIYPVAALLLFLKLRAKYKNRKLDRYRRLKRIIGSSASIPIKKLQKTIGLSYADTVKHLDEMITKGYLGTEAYIDHSQDMLVLMRGASYSDSSSKRTVGAEFNLEDLMNMAGSFGSFARTIKDGIQSGFQSGFANPNGRTAEDSRSDFTDDENETAQRTTETVKPQREQAAKASASDTDAAHVHAVAQLRKLNDQILDEAVSRKIDRIVELTDDIYTVVEEHPDRRDSVRRFMNYYLPTTIKLLTSYGLLERQSYQGENIVASRKNIEEIMDKLVYAFEKQLDQLFASDAVDISSDIQVLETMIAKDGLARQAMQLRL